jgi:hypothetical protein
MPSKVRTKRAPAFVHRERSRQVAYLGAGFRGNVGYRGSPCRLNPSDKRLNLAPSIRDVAARHFREKGIAWHYHANHGLSSQVCCLNCLMPLAERSQTLSKLVGAALAIENPEMLEVEPGPDGSPWFIGFEWNGGADYLNEADEAGKRTRGANSTSADAFVRFRHNGRDEGLLIEWKYTESYGPPIPPKGNATRIERYKDIAFAPHGAIRSDLT